MSYSFTLPCGCRTRVETSPRTRKIERRSESCPLQHHQQGVRVWLWEMLLDPREPIIGEEPHNA